MSASSATDSTRCYENRPQALKDGSEGSMTPDTTKASISSWSSINANLSAHPAFRSISQANLNKFRGLSDLYALASRAKALNELVDWVTMSGRTYKIIRKHNEKKALVRNSCLPVIIEEQTHDEGEPMSPDNSPRPDASDAQFRAVNSIPSFNIITTSANRFQQQATPAWAMTWNQWYILANESPIYGSLLGLYFETGQMGYR